VPLNYYDFTVADTVRGVTEMGPFGLDTADGPVRVNRYQDALSKIKQYVGAQPEGTQGYGSMQLRFQAYTRNIVLVAPFNADLRYREAADFILPGVASGNNSTTIAAALALASTLGGGVVYIAPGGEAPDFTAAITVPSHVKFLIGAGQTVTARAGTVLLDGGHLELEPDAALVGLGNVPVVDMQGSRCSIVGPVNMLGTTASIRRGDTSDAPVVKCYGTGAGLLHRFGSWMHHVSLSNNDRNAPIVDIKQVSSFDIERCIMGGGTGGGIVATEYDGSVIADCFLNDVSTRGASFPTNVKGCIHLGGGNGSQVCQDIYITRVRFNDYHDTAIFIDNGVSTGRNNDIHIDGVRSSNAVVRAAPAVYIKNASYVTVRDARVSLGNWSGGTGAAQNGVFVSGCRGAVLEGITAIGTGTQRSLQAGLWLDSNDGLTIDSIWGDFSTQNTPTSALVVWSATNTNVNEGAIAILVDPSGGALEQFAGPTSYATVAKGMKVTNAAVSGAFALDVSKGDVFDLTLTGGAGQRALSFTGWPTAPEEATIKVYVRNDGSGGKTPLWPTVKWPGGTIPIATSTAASIDIYVFSSPDGGNTVFGVQVESNFS
jgi:hypothetical protein